MFLFHFLCYGVLFCQTFDVKIIALYVAQAVFFKLLIRWSPALLSRFDIKSCRFCCEFYMDAVCEFLRRWNYVWQMSICLMDCCIFGTGRMVVKDLSPCPNR